MILDLVRMKINAARSKIVSTVIATLISGLKPGQKVKVTVNVRPR